MNRLMLTAAFCTVLAACSTTPTTFAPAAGPQAVGFSEYRIEPGRYRVTFRGGPGAPSEQVSDFALLRAADLTLAQGFEWFRVTDRYIGGDSRNNNNSRLSVGAGGLRSGASTAMGLSLGTSFDLGGGPQLTQTLEIMMGRGPRPPGADVYDAQQVRQVIGARA